MCEIGIECVYLSGAPLITSYIASLNHVSHSAFLCKPSFKKFKIKMIHALINKVQLQSTPNPLEFWRGFIVV